MPDDAPKYAKPFDHAGAPWRDPSLAHDDTAFVLRITLGDMPIEDGFWIALPDDISSLSLRELFKRVFPTNPSLQQPFVGRLDANRNPDLPDMYDALVEIFAREELGLCSVETHVNHGPMLDNSTVVSQHLARNDFPPLLELVLEQRFSAIDYSVRRGDFRDVEEALTWVRTRVLLFFLGASDYALPTEPADDVDATLLPVAQALVAEGLIDRSEETGQFELTESGQETVNGMMDEAETVIERYEVFADVLYDSETGDCEFDSEAGIDLRIPVYEAEGLSASRAVMFVELCDGEFALMADDWRTVVHEREFFESLLLPVVERPLISPSDLDAIIDAGFELMEQQASDASIADEDTRLRRSIDL